MQMGLRLDWKRTMRSDGIESQKTEGTYDCDGGEWFYFIGD
jgi:hypothetical protein